MATVKFLIQSSKGNAPIYLRLSLGRNNIFKQKTGQYVDTKLWNAEAGAPKGRDEAAKTLKSKLLNLEAHILDELNKDNAKGVIINSAWLKSAIDSHYNRKEADEKDFIVDYGDFYASSLKDKVTSKGTKVTKDTIGKYNTIVDKLRGFEAFTKRRYLCKELDSQFARDFKNYLSQEEKLTHNTVGRYITFVRTLLLDAQKNGYEVSSQLHAFRGFTVETPIVTLSFEELELIKAAEIENPKLQVARDWLIIGCYVGQRVSDLLRMNRKMISKVKDVELISIVQEKTKKLVQIPIHPEVQTILNKRDGEFPPVFANTPDSNSTMFNRYLKDLCEEAKLNTPTKGNLRDPETGEYNSGEFPKYKLVSSHICRRSFATNFYAEVGFTTPMLMNITGHGTETMFLKYIGKKPVDYALQIAKLWAKEVAEREAPL